MKKLIFAGLLLIGNFCFAQKLPNVQATSLRAPANVKIDGKTNEWGELRAYNPITQVYYTLANDDENLYLAIKAPSIIMVEKIIKGGITLSINTAAKKKGKGIPAITFPMYDAGGPKFYIILDNKPEPVGNTAKDKMTADSFVRQKSKQLAEHMKWIGTANIKGISDSLTAIYNQDGIKVSYALDGEMCYNYELAVPLKSLGLSPATGKFFYNVQLNGISFYYVSVVEPRPGYFSMVAADGKSFMISGSRDTHADKIFPNDFWAEYTLAK